jgi:hypothetical protein
MSVFSTLSKVLPSLGAAQLGATVVLAGFGLAAFAIYAVMQIAKDRRK